MTYGKISTLDLRHRMFRGAILLFLDDHDTDYLISNKGIKVIQL